jgi:predicted Rossmann fold nucleotide-binding protein DprA/Smf involved in DNA uptake
MTTNSGKDALKALREERRASIEAARERIKENRALRKQIIDALKDGPKTVPEIAQITGIPSHQVLWQLTSMKKYGKAAEGDQSGDYFQYILLKE